MRVLRLRQNRWRAESSGHSFLCLYYESSRWIFVVTALHVVANVQKQSADGTTFVNSDDGKTFLSPVFR